jgi:hypothetical protein
VSDTRLASRIGWTRQVSDSADTDAGCGASWKMVKLQEVPLTEGWTHVDSDGNGGTSPTSPKPERQKSERPHLETAADDVSIREPDPQT